ncbi:MAG: DUF2461 domain-containing protein [Acidimicrobiales bacterium]
MTAFAGFTTALYEFFEDLEDENRKEWFDVHRQVYLDQVKAPLQALLDELEPEFGKAKLFRINRDTRFSADKSPYKTQQGAIISAGAAGTRYVHVDADGIMVGVGAPHLDREQLKRWRAAVAGDPGDQLAEIVGTLRAGGFTVGTLASEGLTEEGDLKRVPKPYPPDHPRADLLRLKKVVAAQAWARPAWLLDRRAVAMVAEAWRTAAPLGDWLAANVGAAAGDHGRRR